MPSTRHGSSASLAPMWRPRCSKGIGSGVVMPVRRAGRSRLGAWWSSTSIPTATIRWSLALSRSGVGASLWLCGSKGITTPTRTSRGFASRVMTRVRPWARSRILGCGNSIRRRERSWAWSSGRRAVGYQLSSCVCCRRRRSRLRQPSFRLIRLSPGLRLAGVCLRPALPGRLQYRAKLMDERIVATALALCLLQCWELLRLAQQASGSTLLGSPSLVMGHRIQASRGSGGVPKPDMSAAI